MRYTCLWVWAERRIRAPSGHSRCVLFRTEHGYAQIICLAQIHFSERRNLPTICEDHRFRGSAPWIAAVRPTLRQAFLNENVTCIPSVFQAHAYQHPPMAAGSTGFDQLVATIHELAKACGRLASRAAFGGTQCVLPILWSIDTSHAPFDATFPSGVTVDDTCNLPFGSIAAAACADLRRSYGGKAWKRYERRNERNANNHRVIPCRLGSVLLPPLWNTDLNAAQIRYPKYTSARSQG